MFPGKRAGKAVDRVDVARKRVGFQSQLGLRNALCQSPLKELEVEQSIPVAGLDVARIELHCTKELPLRLRFVPGAHQTRHRQGSVRFRKRRTEDSGAARGFNRFQHAGLGACEAVGAKLGVPGPEYSSSELCV